MNRRQTQAKIDEIKMEFAISSSLIYFNCRYVGVDFWDDWHCQSRHVPSSVGGGQTERYMGE